VACPEAIAYRMGYVGQDDLAALAEPMRQNSYAAYLLQLVEDGR
jgi:glucose-1-phosphate thymidylyltransferase